MMVVDDSKSSCAFCAIVSGQADAEIVIEAADVAARIREALGRPSPDA